jgi:putative membrane protein
MVSLDFAEFRTDASPGVQSLVAQRYDDDHMDWDGGGWLMLSAMAVFWLGLLVLIAWAIATWSRQGGRHEDSALEIARRRYARGEITAEEFERIKRDIA